jgi:hypothetical protein
VVSLGISPNYANDQTVFAGTYAPGEYQGIYKSTDGGLSWSKILPTGSYVSSFGISPNYASDQTVFAGTDGGGVYKSTDGGLSWSHIGLANVFSLGISPNYANDWTIFAGTDGGGVFSNTFVDTTPPTTTASPAGGTYISSQSITLTCNDGSGSGCKTTYYCLGSGCNPTTVYSGIIKISSSTTLRFYSTDNANNSESIKTETYTIGITCSLTPSGITQISKGANVNFLATAQNDTDQVQVFQFGSKVTLPNGNTYPSSGWLFGPVTVTLNPHASKSKDLTQFIPYNAPFGTYTYHGYVGKAGPPIVKYNECQFTFTVVQ